MCRKLEAPMRALHRAVQEGKIACNQEFFPHTGSPKSKHSWLWTKALKIGKSTDQVDLHLHHLLWTSSVVCEQILRSAPIEDGTVEKLLVGGARKLCEIWSDVKAEDDFQSALDLLEKIRSEAAGNTWQLASFIHQKLSWAKSSGPIREGDELPSFLWVNSADLKREMEPLGDGGYGSVHKAEWLGGSFAEKRFHSDISEEFGREATIQAQLCHPNVIPLVCCTRDRDKEKCGLVMEHMQHDLWQFMRQRMEKGGSEHPFPTLLAVDLMLQIARGMEYLHGLRIIHRDLKSHNILVNLSNRAGVDAHPDGVYPDVHLKVADFGVSKAKLVTSRYTSKPIGTMQWRAPELFKDGHEGGDAKYTNKADVYSFGIVCYEILTGKVPFEGHNIQRRVQSGERPSLPKKCPMALSSYIEQCWDKDSHQRPTFTQICQILRYIKVLVLLHNYDKGCYASEYNEFPLRYSFSSSDCVSIQSMLQEFEQKLDKSIYPRSLVIPFEMYCCRVVLQQRSRGNYSCVTFLKWLWEWCVKSAQHDNSNEATCTSGIKEHVNSNEATCIPVPQSCTDDICLDNALVNDITIRDLERPNPSAQNSNPPGNFNGDVFIEYIGAQYNGVRFSDVPINSNVSFRYILAFAIDYTTRGGIRPCDGEFHIYWQHSVLSPDAIASIKARYSNVKVMLSLGGATCSDQEVQFSPKTVESWVTNAVNSLTRLIERYHLDGIDIMYENFQNSSPDMFATCIGQLITQMKERHLISLASIAPSDDVESHYLKLWEDHGDLIDYVNFQFYTYSTKVTEEVYVNLYQEAAVKYGGGSKVLASFHTSPDIGPTPRTVLAASRVLQNSGKLPGINIWCADTSHSTAFKYDIEAQALLAREE